MNLKREEKVLLGIVGVIIFSIGALLTFFIFQKLFPKTVSLDDFDLNSEAFNIKYDAYIRADSNRFNINYWINNNGSKIMNADESLGEFIHESYNSNVSGTIYDNGEYLVASEMGQYAFQENWGLPIRDGYYDKIAEEVKSVSSRDLQTLVSSIDFERSQDLLFEQYTNTEELKDLIGTRSFVQKTNDENTYETRYPDNLDAQSLVEFILFEDGDISPELAIDNHKFLSVEDAWVNLILDSDENLSEIKIYFTDAVYEAKNDIYTYSGGLTITINEVEDIEVPEEATNVLENVEYAKVPFDDLKAKLSGNLTVQISDASEDEIMVFNSFLLQGSGLLPSETNLISNEVYELVFNFPESLGGRDKHTATEVEEIIRNLVETLPNTDMNIDKLVNNIVDDTPQDIIRFLISDSTKGGDLTELVNEMEVQLGFRPIVGPTAGDEFTIVIKTANIITTEDGVNTEEVIDNITNVINNFPGNIQVLEVDVI